MRCVCSWALRAVRCAARRVDAVRSQTRSAAAAAGSRRVGRRTVVIRLPAVPGTRRFTLARNPDPFFWRFDWDAPSAEAAVAAGGEPLVCEQRAGEVILVPPLWGHATINQAPALGFATELSAADRAFDAVG